MTVFECILLGLLALTATWGIFNLFGWMEASKSLRIFYDGSTYLNVSDEAATLIRGWIKAKGSGTAFWKECLSTYWRFKAGEYMTREEWEATAKKETPDA